MEKQTIQTLQELMKTGERINSHDAYDIMVQATQEGRTICMLWKIPSKNYKLWYETNKHHLPTTLEEETTYLVYSGEKAFNPHMGGYSIFARSIGSYIRNSMELERIEDYKCEYAILIKGEIK